MSLNLWVILVVVVVLIAVNKQCLWWNVVYKATISAQAYRWTDLLGFHDAMWPSSREFG